MRYSMAAAALVATASATMQYTRPAPASNETVYVTSVVSSYTTYCPSATEVEHNGVTYTVTSATTLTITDCPCTVTSPVAVETTPVETHPAASSAPETTAAPVPATSSAVETHPAATSSVEETTPVETHPAPSSTYTAPAAPYPSSNATSPVTVPAPVGTGSPVTTAPAYTGPAATGAGSKVAGAGLAAIFGLAVLAL